MNKKSLFVLARDFLGFAAVGCVAYGSWLIYEPAGFIVFGGLVLAGVFLSARGGD